MILDVQMSFSVIGTLFLPSVLKNHQNHQVYHEENTSSGTEPLAFAYVPSKTMALGDHHITWVRMFVRLAQYRSACLLR
jgi:hypothetical protein